MRHLVLSFLLIASSAAAEDVGALKQRYYDVRGDCREGMRPDGRQLTTEESDKACAELPKLSEKLQADGYCWDNAELIWDECPLVN